MPLQKQNVSISFTQGVETKVDEKQIPLGKLAELHNATFTSPGQIKKKNGSVELVAPSTAGYGIGTFQDQLFSITDVGFSSYSSEKQQNYLVSSAFVQCDLSTQSLQADGLNIRTSNSAYHPAGIIVLTYTDSTGESYFKSLDALTGATLLSSTKIGTGTLVAKPITLGQFVFVFYFDGAVLKYIPYAIANPTTVPTAVTFTNTIDTTDYFFDVCVLNTKMYVVWAKSGGGISYVTMNPQQQQSTIVTESGMDGDAGVNIFADKTLNQIWLASYDGTTLKYKVVDAFLNQYLAATTVQAISLVKNFTGICDNGTGNLYYEVVDASKLYLNITRKANLNNIGTVTSDVYLRSVGILGKAFHILDRTKHCIPLGYRSGIVGSEDAGLQSTGFLVCNGHVIGKFAPEESLGRTSYTDNFAHVMNLPEAWTDADGAINFSFEKATFLYTTDTGSFFQYGSSLATYNFSSSKAISPIELSNTLLLAGGIVWEYDGRTLSEQNFNLFPEKPILTDAGAGSLSAGTYGYIVTYEWIDNAGQVHRSAPSLSASITLAASHQVTLVVPTLNLTDKSNVNIVVYRTEANGTVYYMSKATIAQTTANTTSASTVTIADNTTDAVLITHLQLYTTGDVVENVAPSAPRYLSSFQSRFISVVSEDDSSFEYSKQMVAGSPCEFGLGFTWNVDSRGGKLLAAEPMDNSLILFKSRSIYSMNGTGPDNTGAQNDFTEPQLINTDVGLKDPKSIVSMPNGLMFKSEKGIYLLDRSFQCSYVGSDVDAYNSSTVVSSILASKVNQVRFGLDTGEVLVYDYFVDQWNVFDNWEQVDATMWRSNYVYLRDNAQILKESETVFSDDGQLAQLKLKTGWISMAGLQGYERVYKALILGKFKSAHTLRVSVAYDFNPNPTQVATINPEDVFDISVYGADATYGDSSPYGGDYPLYQFRLNFERQKCQAIQLTIEDTSTDPGESMALSALALQVGVKAGLNKQAVSRSFT